MQAKEKLRSVLHVQIRADQPKSPTTWPAMEKSDKLTIDNPRRRNRRINSCLACRQRKLKCNRQQPCSNCGRAGRECVFLRLDSHHSAHKNLTAVKEQTALLEKSLERNTAVAKSTKSGSRSPEDEDEGGDEDDLLVTSLELALLGIQDAAYTHEEDDDSDDDLYDLGFRFGKMRVNERVGGFFHPQMADEVGMPSTPPGYFRGEFF